MTGLPGILRWFRPEEGACLLMFHGFTDVTCEPGIGNTSGLSLDIAVFEEMCELLAERYSVAPLEEVVELLRDGKKLPPTRRSGKKTSVEKSAPALRVGAST